MRGRRPKSTSLKLLQGTLRKDRLNVAEPRPPPAVPTCPSWLNALGRAAWRYYARQLVEMRVLTLADRTTLAHFCDAEAVYRTARAVLERDGMTFSVQTESGTVIRPRPEVAIAQAADRSVRAWGAELGLSPAARPRVHAQPAGRAEESGFARLARERKLERYFGPAR